MGKRVAVIGAGVVGLACAAHLQMRGYSIVVLDPRDPGSYCSYGNAGCLSRASCVPLGLPGVWKKVPGWLMDPKGPLVIPPRYALSIAPWLWRFWRNTSLERVNRIADSLHSLLDVSIDKWRTLAAWAGVPELIRQDGYAFVYRSEAAYRGDSPGRELRRARGVEMELLTGGAIREFDRELSSAISHMVLMPQQGHVPNPLRLSRALAARLRAGGAAFLGHSASGFELANGRVTRIVTDRGPVEADHVVIAAGAHSKDLAQRLGSKVPLETERGYHVMVETPSVQPRIPVCSGEGKYFVTPMEGGLRIAGTVELAGLEAPANYGRADALLEAGRDLLPALAYGKVDHWMGHRPSLPDSMPVIGRSPHVLNAFFAFGHGHVGLTAAAPTGELVADALEARPSFMRSEAFNAGRFEA